MSNDDETVERVARALAAEASTTEMGAAGFNAIHRKEYVEICWRDHEDRARAALSALPPRLSPELIAQLNKLATYLTEQGEYEACDLIDTVVARMTNQQASASGATLPTDACALPGGVEESRDQLQRELLREALTALDQCAEALCECYDVTAYPADGSSKQDAALARARAAADKIRAALGGEKP